ncbi:MAG TPA: complement resistance protein TraT [Geminicoccaceae bacterium]
MAADPRRWLLLGVLVFSISGCAAASTAIGKRELAVETLMSSSIFLEPVRPDQRSIFVEVKNTSEHADFDLGAEVAANLAGKGYRIVDDPADARYLLQANVLQAGRSSDTAAEKTFGGGFGSAVFGGAIGAAAGRAATSDVGAIIAGGLVGAAASVVADSFIQDVTYTVTADVQVSERANEGVIVTETLEQPLFQGGGEGRLIRSSETHDWKRYQTRIMSVANKANLEFEEAAPTMVEGLTRSIAGIF